MRIYTLFTTLILVISLTSCGSNASKNLAEEITVLEAKMEESPTSEEVNELLEKYNTYADKYPNEKEWGAKYMYRAGSIFYRNKDFTNAMIMLEKGIKGFEDAEATPNSYLLYGSTAAETGRPEVAAKYYKDYLEKYPDHSGVFEAYIVCKNFIKEAPKHELAEEIKAVLPDKATFSTKLKALEDASTTDDGTGFKRTAFTALSDGYEAFATLFDKDEEAPSYWYKVSECEKVAGNFSKALEALSKAYNRYPESSWAPKALFQMAFTYEENLKNIEQAKKLYSEFLEKYPDDELATSAQFSLDNIGISPEEIIKKFEEQNKDAQ